MLCPTTCTRASNPAELVNEALRDLSTGELTLELVTDPKDLARWNRLVRKYHYLKEHRMVGESLRYVAKITGKWIALLGWSSAAFHLRARDAWIGWTDSLRKNRRSLVACNARFVLLGPNSLLNNGCLRGQGLRLRKMRL